MRAFQFTQVAPVTFLVLLAFRFFRHRGVQRKGSVALFFFGLLLLLAVAVLLVVEVEANESQISKQTTNTKATVASNDRLQEPPKSNKVIAEETATAGELPMWQRRRGYPSSHSSGYPQLSDGQVYYGEFDRTR